MAKSERRRGRGKTNIPLRGLNAFLRDQGYTAEQRSDELGRAQRTIERWDEQDRDAEFADMHLPASEILDAITAYSGHLRSKAKFGDYRPVSLSKPPYGPREQFVIDAIRRKESELAGLEEAFKVETEYWRKGQLVEEILKVLERSVRL